jgi:hypothetical protein
LRITHSLSDRVCQFAPDVCTLGIGGSQKLSEHAVGPSFAGSDFEALEMSRQSRESRGLVSEVCVVAQSIGPLDLSVTDDERLRKKFHLRRTGRGWAGIRT